MIQKQPVTPVLSQGETKAYLSVQCSSISSWLPDSLLLVRAPGALGVGTLGTVMPDLAAEVASAGEGVMGGVAVCGV